MTKRQAIISEDGRNLIEGLFDVIGKVISNAVFHTF